MAKKVVATLKTKGVKNYAKVIRAVKSDKTGAYTFKEEIVSSDHVKDALAKK
jgi:hypothetical protein